MPNIQGMSRAQTIFLRAFRTDPSGPGVEKWPSPAILRRWLRRPGFVQAMRSIRDAMRYQADFQLLAAAASAAHAMHTSVSATEGELQTARLNAMSSLMKLAHLRQRFAPPEPPVPVRITTLEDLLCTAHPEASIDTVLRYYRTLTGCDLRAEVLPRLQAAREARWSGQSRGEQPIGGGLRSRDPEDLQRDPDFDPRAGADDDDDENDTDADAGTR